MRLLACYLTICAESPAAHASTVDRLASVLAPAAERNGEALAVPVRQLAELVLAIETGIALATLFAGSPA